MSAHDLIAKFRRNTPAQSLAAVLSAIVFFLVYWQVGRAGDCKLHEVDGQCGMSTAISFVFGLFGGAVIMIASAVAIWINAARRAEAEREEGRF